MKSSFITILFSILLFTISCSKDDDSESTSTSKASYKNQPLQGKINGVDWFFMSGNVRSDTSGYDKAKTWHSFYFADTIASDSCFTKAGRPFLTLDFHDKNPILAVGSYALNDEFNEFSKSVVFGYWENNLANLNTAYSGAFEIISVDILKGLVTGRMDVRIDGNNYVNGNFTIKYCNL